MQRFIIICLLLFCASHVSAQSKSVSQDSLKLTSPNGGEIFFIGSDTVITWTGIPLTDTVKLEYSSDAGSSWNFITDKATGGSYQWHVPKAVSDSCLVRVEEIETSYNWAVDAEFADSSSSDGNTVVTDLEGNIFVVGCFIGKVKFGTTQLTSSQRNIFLAKYDPLGNVLWAKNIGGNQCENSIALDSTGNIYITGYFEGTAYFDGVSLVSNSGSEDIFIAKYTRDGNLIWVQKAGGNGINVATSIATDALGNAYITGAPNFISKYRPDGSVEWVRQVMPNLSSYSYGTGVAISYDGLDLYITGSFDSIIALNSTNCGFVTRYHSDGSFVWSKIITPNIRPVHSTEPYRSAGIAIDGSENIYITGGYTDDLNLDTILFKHELAFNESFIIAKYDLNGNIQWVKKIDEYPYYYGGDCTGYNIVADNFGNIFVSGIFGDSIIVFANDTLKNSGWNDTFVAKFQSDGKVLWEKKQEALLMMRAMELQLIH